MFQMILYHRVVGRLQNLNEVVAIVRQALS